MSVDHAAARAAAAATAYPSSTSRSRDDWPTPLLPEPTRRPLLVIQGIAAKQIDMSWRTNDAACIGTDPDLFFSESLADCRQAQAICHTCPLIDACRDHAVQHERFGVWGGLSEKQRRTLRRGLEVVAS